ncbi:large conductance mechanosensitive channel protein MscL [Luteolibacter sp. GHJ8]|uniref:Large-conductance mechanosensitive channel n=1 Tax=Luteolibacter rhizosphaerae TaxID=2989719 RepID=A0ABT3G0C3_9BACT|nr:large conductance mechanosensitive channel protein MscL [Luteolibacter rhizosphaerae]MCW1913286.1 large conductance mechanosensitive channel protein MscL [Luteolibacter rhizosphaerae]
MIKEFRDFILKGNMLDLAVGVIIGASFGKVVTSFTELLLSAITFGTGTTEVGAVPVAKKMIDGKEKLIDLGPLINSFISLVIVGFALFLVVKAYTTAKKRFEAPVAPAGPTELPADVKLLAEIRDLLKSQQGKA